MKIRISILLLSLLAFLAPAQGLKYSQYPQTNRFHGGFLILWADPGKTNLSQSGTDLEAQLFQDIGSVNVTNVNIQYITNLYAYITNLFSTNAFITNIYVLSLTNAGVAANSAVITDSHQVETNAVNAHGVFTNTASGPPKFGLLQNTELQNNSITVQGSAVALGGSTLAAGSTPFFDGSNITNSVYKYTTNIVGAANFVFGKAYWTNITGNFTFPALTMQDNAAMETLAVWVTNSGASTFTATINGVAGAPGRVIPAVFYCTNATVTEIDVSHFGVLWTNACVSKN